MVISHRDVAARHSRCWQRCLYAVALWSTGISFVSAQDAVEEPAPEPPTVVAQVDTSLNAEAEGDVGGAAASGSVDATSGVASDTSEAEAGEPSSAEVSAEAEPEAAEAETKLFESKKGFSPELHYGVGLRAQVAGLKGDEPTYTGVTASPLEDGLVASDIAIRPYIYGSFHEKIAFEANLEAWAGVPGAAADVHILDAVFKIQLHDLLQIWVGRFLPPADRSDLSGPFFLNSWLYPLEMGYPPSITAGRDNGFAVWGQAFKGMLKYQVGLFNLDGGAVRPMARVTVNVLDPESETPFYYNSSTYYGEKGTILALALSGGFEKDGLVTEDWKAIQSDVLFEMPLAGGALNAEGAFYWYDSEDMRLMMLASYLLPQIPLQPNLRVMATGIGADPDAPVSLDAGVNLILRGHNMRIALLYRGDYNREDNLKAHGAVLGFQGQIWP